MGIFDKKQKQNNMRIPNISKPKWSLWGWLKSIFKTSLKPNPVNTEQIVSNNENKGYKWIINPNIFTLSKYGFSIPQISYYKQVYDGDSHFFASMNTLWEKVISLDWNIQFDVNYPKRYNKSVLEYVQNTFNRLDVNKITQYMLYAHLYGKSILQIMYETNSTTGYIEVKDIDICHPDYFEFDINTGDLLFVEKKTWGNVTNLTKDHPHEFVVYAYKGTNLNPHGDSLIGKRGCQLYYIKQALMESYVATADLFSNPNLIATIKRWNDNGDKQLLSDSEFEQLLTNLQSHIIEPAKSGKRFRAVLPNTATLSYLQPDMSKMFNVQSAIDLINREISKLVLGSTKVNEGTETTGSYAQSYVHEETTENRIEQIAKDIESTWAKIIKTIVDLNFDNIQTYPQFRIQYRREVVDDKQFNIILSLMDRGMEVSKSWLYEKYGIVPPINEEDVFVVSKATTVDNSNQQEESNQQDDNIEDDNNSDEEEDETNEV